MLLHQCSRPARAVHQTAATLVTGHDGSLSAAPNNAAEAAIVDSVHLVEPGLSMAGHHLCTDLYARRSVSVTRHLLDCGPHDSGRDANGPIDELSHVPNRLPHVCEAGSSRAAQCHRFSHLYDRLQLHSAARMPRRLPVGAAWFTQDMG